MAIDVVIKDETTSGDVLGELALQLEAEQTSIRELIDVRVRSEVRAHNASRLTQRFRGLVQPAEDEQRLNPARAPRRIDADKQVAVALQAFERGHILVLVDDRQRTDLDGEIVLRPGSTVSFLKLVPLVGG